MKTKLKISILVGAVALAGFSLLGTGVAAPVGGAAPAGKLGFNHDIRPILAENCFACHGPDPAARKGGLRFDREEGLFGDRKGGKAVIKGDSKASILYQRIMTMDEEDVMPPLKSHKKLKPEEKEKIRKWIDQGAPWEAHWSLIAPVRPSLPPVKNAAWVRNPIDAFVLSKLEAAGLSPAPEADRRALARRVALDLTGLPPEPDAVEAFVKDTAADAYEKFVDQMLSSPDYGEHRARYWLDAARYADTHGLHFDNERSIWPFREWVINAYNANMHFDQFTIEQLAGDLLPNRTLEQQIASGFLRCQVTTNEGGTIAEENLVFYTRDRTETASRVWLGTTAGCCVCHDHKFDPFTQKDFYSMSAFFNNATVGALDGNIKDSPPVLVVPTAADRPGWEKLNREVTEGRKELDARRAAARSEYEQWAAASTPEAIHAATPSANLQLLAPLNEGQGTTTKVSVGGREVEVPLESGASWQRGQVSPQAAQVSDGTLLSIPDAGDFDRNQPFSVSIWAKIPANSTGAIVSRMGPKEEFQGWDFFIDNGKLVSHISNKWKVNAIKVLAFRPLDASKWHHLALTYDGTSKATGLKIYVDGEVIPTRAELDTLTQPTRTSAPLRVGKRDDSTAIKSLTAQELRIYGQALSPADVRRLAKASQLATLVAKPAGKRTEPEKKELFEWWLANIDPAGKATLAKLETAERSQNEMNLRGAPTLVMQEKNEAPTAYILFRGEYDKRRDQVAPGTPVSLPAFPTEAPKNRLGFAQWLLRPEQPLTARVTVNRFWQEIFGTGIVKTSEDFGLMGENPSNQELLDWLAVDFREGNWDVKRLLKMIVTSAAYRQAAVATPEKLEKDPDNRLISRGPRFRLDGEALRDSALSTSGLLVRKIGGPSVKPYQPPGVWEAVAMIGSNTRDYREDTGENLYRRSLYTFWKRSAPPASMDIFNAPSREACTVRRERTNTPLQALVTMNDPQFVEAARSLAQNAIKQGGNATDARINWIGLRLLSRPLRPEEMQVAQGALADLVSYYKANAEDAKKLLEVGQSKRDEAIDASEHAAWTMLTNQLMNLDEFVTK